MTLEGWVEACAWSTWHVGDAYIWFSLDAGALGEPAPAFIDDVANLLKNGKIIMGAIRINEKTIKQN